MFYGKVNGLNLFGSRLAEAISEGWWLRHLCSKLGVLEKCSPLFPESQERSFVLWLASSVQTGKRAPII